MNNIMRFVLTAQAWGVVLRQRRPAAQTLGRYKAEIPLNKLNIAIINETSQDFFYTFCYLKDKYPAKK